MKKTIAALALLTGSVFLSACSKQPEVTTVPQTQGQVQVQTQQTAAVDNATPPAAVMETIPGASPSGEQTTDQKDPTLSQAPLSTSDDPKAIEADLKNTTIAQESFN